VISAVLCWETRRVWLSVSVQCVMSLFMFLFSITNDHSQSELYQPVPLIEFDSSAQWLSGELYLLIE